MIRQIAVSRPKPLLQRQQHPTHKPPSVAVLQRDAPAMRFDAVSRLRASPSPVPLRPVEIERHQRVLQHGLVRAVAAVEAPRSAATAVRGSSTHFDVIVRRHGAPAAGFVGILEQIEHGLANLRHVHACAAPASARAGGSEICCCRLAMNWSLHGLQLRLRQLCGKARTAAESVPG